MNRIARLGTFILGVFLLLFVITACSSKGEKSSVKDSEQTEAIDEVNQVEKDVSFIKEWYGYILGDKGVSNQLLDKYLSPDVKKRLWTDDYDGTYEFYRFRTTAQDYNPEDGDTSKIEQILDKGEGWYEVSYLDMGTKGKTKVKIRNNKIVDFVQDASWDLWDAPSNGDNQSNDNLSNSSSNDDTSKERLIFSNEQYIIGHLLNQRFIHSSGLEIRFDGDGRMYVDGDAAGVISVVRHDSESAILRYGNGMYGEGKLFMQYANGKIQLTDTADGSVFYQK